MFSTARVAALTCTKRGCSRQQALPQAQPPHAAPHAANSPRISKQPVILRFEGYSLPVTPEPDSTSKQWHLHRAIVTAPGQGTCPPRPAG